VFKLRSPLQSKIPVATIVCVDDDPGVLLLHKMLLEDEGNTVRTPGDGPTALTLCQPHLAAWLVLDYLMHGMDGAQVAFQLRCSQPKLPILPCTGCTQQVPEQLRVLVSSIIEIRRGTGALLAAVRELLPPRATIRHRAKKAAVQSSLADWRIAVNGRAGGTGPRVPAADLSTNKKCG
jgi:CheY-like chemotaxis protein